MLKRLVGILSTAAENDPEPIVHILLPNTLPEHTIMRYNSYDDDELLMRACGMVRDAHVKWDSLKD